MPEERTYLDGTRSLSVAITMQDLAGGGVERQTLALAGELQESGVAVTLLVNEATGELRDAVPASIRLVDLQRRRTSAAMYSLRPLKTQPTQS